MTALPITFERWLHLTTTSGDIETPLGTGDSVPVFRSPKQLKLKELSETNPVEPDQRPRALSRLSFNIEASSPSSRTLPLAYRDDYRTIRYGRTRNRE